MSAVSRDRDLACLERELRTEEYQGRLASLQEREPLRGVATWAEFVTLVWSLPRGDWERRDALLRPIFAAHAADRDPRWRTVLLVAFWPGLLWVWKGTRRLDRDDEERWQRTVWAFYEVICRIDLSRRRDRLGQKVVNDVLNRTRNEYRRERGRAEVEIQPGPGLIERVAARTSDEIRELDYRRDLVGHARAGRIAEEDIFLILGTRLYGKTLAEFADGVGLTPEAAKKRRLRAEAALRRFAKKSE